MIKRNDRKKKNIRENLNNNKFLVLAVRIRKKSAPESFTVCSKYILL